MKLLSVGAGTTGAPPDLHDFSAMAEDIAKHYAHGSAIGIRNASRQDFLDRAPAHDVLHLSVHGTVQRGRLDPLAASTLVFADGIALSARQWLEAWPEGARHEAVFLNACVSGGYGVRPRR